MLVYNTDYKITQFYDGTSWSGQVSGCVPKVNSSNAGVDLYSVSLSIALNGNKPSPGVKGLWTVVSGTGGTFTNASDPTTTFTGVDHMKYLLKWSLFSRCDTTFTTIFVQIGLPSITSNGTTLYVYPVDNSSAIKWSIGTSYPTTGASSLTDGKANTTAIVAAQGAGNYAAYLCDTLTALGYSDWYLPAKEELKDICTNQVILGGFASFGWYFSSTEYYGNARCQRFDSFCYQEPRHKSSVYRMRCVRRDD